MIFSFFLVKAGSGRRVEGRHRQRDRSLTHVGASLLITARVRHIEKESAIISSIRKIGWSRALSFKNSPQGMLGGLLGSQLCTLSTQQK